MVAKDVKLVCPSSIYPVKINNRIQFIQVTLAKAAPKQQTLEVLLKGEKFPQDCDKVIIL